MGVVNLTPDSFSDGGRYLKAEDAIARARALIADGADIIHGWVRLNNPAAPGGQYQDPPGSPERPGTRSRPFRMRQCGA